MVVNQNFLAIKLAREQSWRYPIEYKLWVYTLIKPQTRSSDRHHPHWRERKHVPKKPEASYLKWAFFHTLAILMLGHRLRRDNVTCPKSNYWPFHSLTIQSVSKEFIHQHGRVLKLSFFRQEASAKKERRCPGTAWVRQWGYLAASEIELLHQERSRYNKGNTVSLAFIVTWETLRGIESHCMICVVWDNL